MAFNPYGRFSLKTKLIMFCGLSIIVAGIAYKAALDNRANRESIIQNNNQSITQNNNQTAVIKSDGNKLQDEKNKRLEEKYDQSTKLFSDKKYTDTINMANDIIKEDESFYKAYNIKGIALCYSGNYDEGMKDIDKALQLKPDFGYARFNKALAYELKGYYDDSLIWYDKNLEVENYIWSYYGKASIYGRRGDVANTVKYLKIAIDMAPEIKKNASEEEDFDPVRDSKEFQDLIK